MELHRRMVESGGFSSIPILLPGDFEIKVEFIKNIFIYHYILICLTKFQNLNILEKN